MGWAKYEEDNRDAIEERWAMRNTSHLASAYSSYSVQSKQKTTQYPIYTYSQQNANTCRTIR